MEHSAPHRQRFYTFFTLTWIIVQDWIHLCFPTSSAIHNRLPYLWHTNLRPQPCCIEYSMAPLVGNARVWRFPNFLKGNKHFKDTIRHVWGDYESFNVGNTADPNLYWDAGKAFLRGKFFSYVTACKFSSKTVLFGQRKTLWATTEPTRSTKHSWQEAKT